MPSLPPAGSQGAILAFLLFHLTNTGWCQHGYIIGLCSDCKDRLKEDLLPWQMNHYAQTNTTTLVCPFSSIIKFQLGNRVVCGKTSEKWVNKLRDCIETKDFRTCKIVTTKSTAAAPTSAFVLTTTTGTELTTYPTSTPKNTKFTEKDEHKITLEPNNDATSETKNDPLAAFVLTTTTDTEMTTRPAQVTTTSAVATPALAFVPTTGTELTSHPTSTPKNPHFTEKDVHKMTLEPKIDATNENKNDVLAAGAALKDELKISTRAPQTDKMKHLMVALLPLALVAILVSYLSCRRKVCLPGRHRRPPDMKLIRTNMM